MSNTNPTPRFLHAVANATELSVDQSRRVIERLQAGGYTIAQIADVYDIELAEICPPMTRQEIADTIVLKPVELDGKQHWMGVWSGPNPGCGKTYRKAENAYADARDFVLRDLHVPKQQDKNLMEKNPHWKIRKAGGGTLLDAAVKLNGYVASTDIPVGKAYEILESHMSMEKAENALFSMEYGNLQALGKGQYMGEQKTSRDEKNQYFIIEGATKKPRF